MATDERTPCEELATTLCLLVVDDGPTTTDEFEFAKDVRRVRVPCRVVPMLTAAEREKLIGEKP